jgi:hypothetical protein
MTVGNTTITLKSDNLPLAQKDDAKGTANLSLSVNTLPVFDKPDCSDTVRYRQ